MCVRFTLCALIWYIHTHWSVLMPTMRLISIKNQTHNSANRLCFLDRENIHTNWLATIEKWREKINRANWIREIKRNNWLIFFLSVKCSQKLDTLTTSLPTNISQRSEFKVHKHFARTPLHRASLWHFMLNAFRVKRFNLLGLSRPFFIRGSCSLPFRLTNRIEIRIQESLIFCHLSFNMLARFVCAIMSPWHRINIGFWLIQCITWNSETSKSTLRLAQRQRKFIRIILNASHSIQMTSTKRHLFLVWRKIGTERKKSTGKKSSAKQSWEKSYLESRSSSRTSVRGTFRWALHLKRPSRWKERGMKRAGE